MRRWQVELAMQSPRLWYWHMRLKLLMLVARFLLSLVAPHLDALHTWLLRNFVHWTDQRHLHVKMPLYRLRSALSRLWLAWSVSPHFVWQYSG